MAAPDGPQFSGGLGDIAPGNQYFPYTWKPVNKGKPVQGKLFDVLPDKPADEHRWPRGYTPERLHEVIGTVGHINVGDPSDTPNDLLNSSPNSWWKYMQAMATNRAELDAVATPDENLPKEEFKKRGHAKALQSWTDRQRHTLIRGIAGTTIPKSDLEAAGGFDVGVEGSEFGPKKESSGAFYVDRGDRSTGRPPDQSRNRIRIIPREALGPFEDGSGDDYDVFPSSTDYSNTIAHEVGHAVSSSLAKGTYSPWEDQRLHLKNKRKTLLPRGLGAAYKNATRTQAKLDEKENLSSFKDRVQRVATDAIINLVDNHTTTVNPEEEGFAEGYAALHTPLRGHGPRAEVPASVRAYDKLMYGDRDTGKGSFPGMQEAYHRGLLSGSVDVDPNSPTFLQSQTDVYAGRESPNIEGHLFSPLAAQFQHVSDPNGKQLVIPGMEDSSQGSKKRTSKIKKILSTRPAYLQ